MNRRKPVGVICQPSNSCSGDGNELEFICSVGGREPHIHKLWSFSEEGITPEVHGDCFHTAYATEIGCKVFFYGRKIINGSVEWLGVPVPSSGTGVAWTENISAPNSRWGDGRGYKHWASTTRSRPCFGGRSVPWRDKVPFCPNYVLSSPKMLAQGRPTSMTFACGRDIWHRLKLSCMTFTSTVTSGVMIWTTAWMAWFMKHGNNFRVRIPLVISVAEIPLMVWVATLWLLFGSLPPKTKISESFMTSTCLA